ncbi:MAG: hypothetical protein ACI82A_000308 [Candidatus Azotimanducaceae bacterium]|jgi:hypothetical protein
MCNPLGLQESEALQVCFGRVSATGLMHFGVIAFSHVEKSRKN